MPVRLGNDSIEIINPDKTYVVDTIKSTGERDGDTVLNVPVVEPEYISQTTITEYTVLDADATNLIAHYKFDGNGDDSSGNNKHLTEYNITYENTDKIIGQSSFHNGTGYFEISNDGYFSPDIFSVSCWVKAYQQASYQTIASCRDASYIGWIIYIQDNYISIFTGKGSSPWILTTTYPNFASNPPVWRHLVVVWNKSTSSLQIYVNGNLESTVSITGYTNNNINNLRIGAGSNEGTANMNISNNSLIDDFRIYDKALTPTEIGYLANNMIKLEPQPIPDTPDYKVLTFTYDETRYPEIDADSTNLRTWYKFDNVNNIGLDSSGNGKTGINYGSSINTLDYKIGSGSLQLSNTYFKIPNLQFTSETTISFWFRWDLTQVTSNYNKIFDFQESITGFRWVWQRYISAQYTYWFMGNGSSSTGNKVMSGHVLNNNQWYFFTLCVDIVTGNLKIYKDASKIWDLNYPGFFSTNVVYDNAHIGAHFNGGSGYMYGNVDDFRIYDKVLSQEEINTLYNVNQTPYTLTFDNPTECDILIVGGGGAGGGGDDGGGGGAGGLVLINNIILNNDYKLLIGKGGIGDTSENNDTENGKDTIFNVDGIDGVNSFTAVGGGGGGVGNNSSNSLRDGNNGGSGGGATGEFAGRFGGSSTQNQYIYNEIQRGYGNKGGDNPNTSTGRGSAGGGGAGFPGTDSNSTDKGVPGGDGLSIVNEINLKTHFNINDTTIGHHTNDEVYFSGGGGGGNANDVSRDDNSGGLGGGGQGSTSGSGRSGTNALINSGGGGGGAQINSTRGKGGNGGSGIVIIRYKQQYNQVPFNAQWTYSALDTSVHHYGNVGIGTIASDTIKLSIRGDVNVIGDYYKNDILLTEQWKTSSQNTNNIYRENGFVGIGTDNVDYGIHVIGQLYAGSGGITGNGSTAWTSTSDSRVKQNIVPASGQKCVENVRNINLYRFNYNSSLIDTDDKHQLGFIAQEVQQYYPKAVKTNNLVLKNNMKIDNLLSVDVTQINYTLYGTVKKLAEDINTIREKLGITEIQTDVKNLAYVRKDGEDSDGLKIS